MSSIILIHNEIIFKLQYELLLIFDNMISHLLIKNEENLNFDKLLLLSFISYLSKILIIEIFS